MALPDWSPWPRGASSPLTRNAARPRLRKKGKRRTNVSMSPRRDHVSRRPRRGAACAGPSASDGACDGGRGQGTVSARRATHRAPVRGRRVARLPETADIVSRSRRGIPDHGRTRLVVVPLHVAAPRACASALRPALNSFHARAFFFKKKFFPYALVSPDRVRTNLSPRAYIAVLRSREFVSPHHLNSAGANQ